MLVHELFMSFVLGNRPNFLEIYSHETSSAFAMSSLELTASAMEFFLSLEKLDGFEEKRRSILNVRRGPSATNNRQVQQQSWQAELNAFYLLAHSLCVELVGFDQISEKARRARSNCDVAIRINGEKAYVEIKKKSAEDKQSPPEYLEERLAKLDLPFDIVPELLDRDYDCSDIDAQLLDLKKHVAKFMVKPRKPRERPPPFFNRSFRVLFFEKGKAQDVSSFFCPDFENQIRDYIVGPKHQTSAVKVSKIEEALDKGADYLFVSVPSWDTLEQIAKACFGDARRISDHSYFSESRMFGGLYGVVLFSDACTYCVVNRLSARREMWLGAK